MAMATVLKMELWDRSDGSARCMVTSVPVEPRKVMNTRDYEHKYRQHLARLKAYNRFLIIINSRGGARDSAIGLMSAMAFELKSKKQPAAILIDGICASAATYLACSLKKVPVYITEGSKYYIHMPKTTCFVRRGGGVWNAIYKAGNKATIRDLVKMYHQKTHVPRRVIREWMENGRYFSASEAVEIGFCDGIMSRYEFEKGGAWSKC